MILVNGRNVNFINFPDGTSSFRFGLEAGTCNISWKYDNDAECMHLLYLVKHLRAMGIDDLYLNMPYIPNARLVQSVQYAPFTRDTFGIAVKATYAKDIDGKSIMIFKNPKTDSGNFKKSQRGCCRVSKDGDEYTYEDGLTWEEAQDNNELKTVFKNGKLLKVYTLDEVRQNLHGGDF